MRHILADVRVRAAAAILIAGVAILVVVVIRATRVDRPATLASSPMPMAATKIAPADTTSDDLIETAIERDPFSPSRSRPTTPYGVPVTAATLNAAPPAPAPTLRLVGTVVDSGGASFAICQLGAAEPHVVHVGQKIGGYLLRSISQGSATFLSAEGERLDLRVPKTGS